MVPWLLNATKSLVTTGIGIPYNGGVSKHALFPNHNMHYFQTRVDFFHFAHYGSEPDSCFLTLYINHADIWNGAGLQCIN